MRISWNTTDSDEGVWMLVNLHNASVTGVKTNTVKPEVILHEEYEARRQGKLPGGEELKTMTTTQRSDVTTGVEMEDNLHKVTTFKQTTEDLEEDKINRDLVSEDQVGSSSALSGNNEVKTKVAEHYDNAIFGLLKPRHRRALEPVLTQSESVHCNVSIRFEKRYGYLILPPFIR